MNQPSKNTSENTENTDLISIVVPVYKVEEILARCIDSILVQTYTHFELILVDDGSPDDCGRICDEYAQKDSRIQVIHQENSGLSEARNSGIDRATGRYIAFIDSDDWIHPDYLTYLYSKITTYDADIACCGLVKTSGETPPSDGIKEEIRLFSNEEAIAQHFSPNHVQIVVAWAKLYDINLFKDVRYPKSKLHEDEFTTYLLLYAARKIVFSNLPFYYYYQRPDSLIGAGFRIEKRLAALEAYTQRADFLSRVGFPHLAAQTYREIFRSGFNIFGHLEGASDQQAVEQFRKDFADLKHKLRKHEYPMKFKAFYEAYFRFPGIICFLHSKLSG
ncbi:MAG: glycosyl transferase [Oleiphilus sp.]|nr:MAG: glycosyl transferase [Oleiphilus sp.]